jgi:hypothetical protein
MVTQTPERGNGAGLVRTAADRFGHSLKVHALAAVAAAHEAPSPAVEVVCENAGVLAGEYHGVLLSLDQERQGVADRVRVVLGMLHPGGSLLNAECVGRMDAILREVVHLVGEGPEVVR